MLGATTAIVGSTAVAIAAPAQAAINAAPGFRANAMLAMPPEYSPKWAGLPAASSVYVNAQVKGGSVQIQYKKTGTSAWKKLATVAVPTSACTAALCSEYDSRRLRDQRTNWYTAPAAGTYDVRVRYLKGSNGNAASTGWVTTFQNTKQRFVTKKVPLAKLTVKAPAKAKAGKKFTASIVATTKDPAAAGFIANLPFDGKVVTGIKATKVKVTWTVKGKTSKLGTFAVKKYNDKKHAFTTSLKLKAKTKGKGKLKFAFTGGAATSNKTITKTITIK